MLGYFVFFTKCVWVGGGGTAAGLIQELKFYHDSFGTYFRMSGEQTELFGKVGSGEIISES